MTMEKHKRLVHLLAIKTERGDLNWKNSPQTNSFQASFKENSVIIEETDSFVAGYNYTMHICDRFGDVIDSFNDNELAADIDTETSSISWSQTMRDLYHAARRVASGSDRALSSIIEELGG